MPEAEKSEDKQLFGKCDREREEGGKKPLLKGLESWLGPRELFIKKRDLKSSFFPLKI